MASNYPFSTTWTGGGDGTSWSDAANWSNGVPLTGAAAPSADQDVATIDNSVVTAPYTVTIAGSQSAGEIDLNASDPVGGVAVSLTGDLNMPINASDTGSGFGTINLDAGTFAIDGGTLSTGEVHLNGGTLVFGSFTQWGDDTLNGSIIDGAQTIGNAATVVIQQNDFAIFDGANGYGTAADDVITDGATLSAQGSLYLSGEIDVQNGTLSLDGGDLTGWGSTGLLYADGGTIDVTHNFSVNAAFTIEGGLTFTNAATVSVAAGGELTLGNDALAAPTVVDLDGGTLDVTGALNLDDTVLENGTLILEAGSTYTIDAASSLSGVTVTDNRPAGQTNWTGAAGDDNWSNPANWTNGVPQAGSSDTQSIAVINDVIDTAPSTIVISGDVQAQDIDVSTTDPSGAPSVSLTGSLDTSFDGEGGAFGQLNLNSGTFEIDGGTLSYTGISLDGGTLAFGGFALGQATLNTDIINGNWAVSDSLVVLSGYDVVHGSGGYGPSTVTLGDGAQLLVASGTLALDGEIDIQDGADSTLFSLDGGNLLGYGGDAATIFIDGGTFAVDQNTTLYNTVNIYGGYMVLASGVTATIDAGSTTTIGQSGASQTVVNLDGGTLDVFGTLVLTNTYIENGTIVVESGATFTQDATDTLSGVSLVGVATTATNWTGAGDGTSWSDSNNWDNGVPVSGANYLNLGNNVTTIDNVHGDANPFSVVITGAQSGALVIVNATDPSGGVAVSLQGSLDLSTDATSNGATLGVLDLDAGTFEVDGGTLSVLNVNQNNTTFGGNIAFGSAAEWGASTLNASGIAGSFTIGNGSDLVIAQYSFGDFNESDGTTVQDVSIDDNSTLDIKGSLGTGNNIDIYSGTVDLDGGSLSMGSGARMISEGGGFIVTGDGTFDNVTYDGAVTIGDGNTLTIAAGDSATLNNLGNQYTINLGGGTVDVQGTLDVEGAIVNLGNLTLENGSKLVDATVNAAVQSDDPTVTIYGSATLDNVAIDAPITMASTIIADVAVAGGSGPSNVLTVDGTTTFGNAADPSPMEVNLNGGVIEVTGTLNLINTDVTDGTIIIEQGGTLTSDAASQLNGVTVEETLGNGDLAISGQNVAINTLQTVTTAQNIDLQTGVDTNGTASGTPGEVTFSYAAGFAGAGLVTVTDGNGVSKTDFNSATLDANVAGQTLTFATDTWLPDYGAFAAENGATLVVGDAANAADNLTDGVFDGGISATGGSTATFYGANGIATVNGVVMLDGTSTIQVATPGGDVALAQSLTSIGSQNPTTYLDQEGILNLDNGASLIDPNAVTLYGTVNLTGGTFSTGGLSGDDVVFNSGFGEVYPSGVDGYGTLDGPFGSTAGNIYMAADNGGTLTFNGTLIGYTNLTANTNSTLVINAAITGTAADSGIDASLEAGSTLDLAGGVTDAAALYVNFDGSNATLDIADPVGQTVGSIYLHGSYTGDAIDLTGLTAAALADGSPDVQIVQLSPISAEVVINPASDPGAYDTITVNGISDLGLTVGSDGHGGTQIAIGSGPDADVPTVTAPATQAVTQNSITALSGYSITEPGALSGENFAVTILDSTGLLSASGSYTTGLGATSITLNGPLSQVNAELASLTLDDPNAGTDTLNVSVQDSFGGTSSQSTAVTSTHVPSPDLTVSAISASAGATEGQTVQLTWTVTNSGDATATGPWTDNVYLASDAAGDNQTLVGSFSYTGSLAPGQSATETQSITVPSSFTVSTQTGTAATYFVVQADAGNQTGALSGLQNHLTVSTAATAVTASVDWSSVFAEIMPAGIDATDYALIEQRWVAEVGTTDASLATAINQTIAALDKNSATAPTSSDALTLLARQAVGGLVDQTLAQVTDPSASGTGLDALLTPSYSSGLASRNNSGVFGDGWASELNDTGPLGPMNGFGPDDQYPGSQSYIVKYVTTYIDQYGDYLGQSVTYQVVAPAGLDINLLDPSNPTSNYTQANANGTTETFDGKTGLLIGISDASGNAIAINRNASGVITSITTASGTPPIFTVNALGNIASAIDSAGNTITYNYDATGTHLLSTTSSAGTTSYQYSSSTNAFIQNALTQVTDPDGSTQAYTYDAQGDIASQSINGAAATTYAYESPNTITQTNGDGQTTTYTYDQNGKTTSVTDAGGNASTIQRDSNGNVTEITTASGNTYHYGYDSSGNLTSSTDPLGNTVHYTYEPGTSQLASVTDQNGNVTQYTYNAAGQSTGFTEADGSGTQYTYDASGQLSETTAATGATIQFSYDAAGQITKELFSDGTSQSYSYDASGNMLSSTAADGGTTTYAYNAQGLLSSVTDPAGQVESYSYNAAGQESQRIEPDGSITNYTYNSTGLLAQVSDHSGNVIARYTYDSVGNLTEKDTGNGAKTLYGYDATGHLAEIKTLASDGSTTSKLDYTYDSDGRIATATSGDGTWTYSYDASNQLSHAVFASTNAAIANQDLTYEYDAAGNRTQTIFNGATTNYATNNLNEYTSANGTTYSYDANGNLVQMVSGGATTTYAYNVQNQLISSTSASVTTSYTYDALGNIATQTVNGVETSYVSDLLAIGSSANGPLSAVAQAYNASGQATATYTYGDGLTAVNSNGTTSYYNADASGNIISLSGASGALTATYDYTPSGTLLASTGSAANPFQFNGQVGAMTQADGLVNIRARTYDPATGRFTSQDPTGQAGGIDLYTYAGNNPVNFIDATGDGVSLAGIAGGVLSIVGGIVTIAAATTLAAPAAILLTTAGGFVAFGTGIKGLADSLNKPAGYHDTAADYGNFTINAGLTFLGGGALKGAGNVVVNVISGVNSLVGVTDGYGNLFTYFGDTYANHNQTSYATVTVDVPEADGWGDVHLTTFDGLHYDFQAVGEFILAKSTVAGDNFQVQVRLSAYGAGADAPTVTTEIGVQVGNDRVTFGVNRAATVWVDGVASGLSTTANTLTLAGGTISELSPGNYQVTESTGEVVDITDSGSYLGYTVDLAPTAKAGSVEGLLGSYSGTANAFELPDGTALGSSLTSVQLYQTFGNAWRITDATSLLDYGQGEDTATYTDLTHPGYGLPVSSLPSNVVAAATAAVAAAGITDPTAAADAVYDYLVTGDPSFIAADAASATSAPATSTAVITQSAPPPPSIGISPSSPLVTEISGQTPVTFTVSLTSAATADTVIDYAVSSTAIDAGKTYFDASDFGGTLPSGSVTILAGQSQATITVDVPDNALGSSPDKWLGVNISTPAADPIYASTAQVDILNDTPVAGVVPQPVLEYVPGNTAGATENTPTLTQSGNSYSLNLGNVEQGTALAALQFALANLASAPADSLSASVVGVSGGGFNESGLQSATVIGAGYASSGVTLQPSTSALGTQSETITLAANDVNSTGYSGSLPNITLTVTENVIAAAQASLGTTAIALPDARVGSTDTQPITVSNTAATGAAPLDVTLGAASGAAATGSVSQLAAGASDSTGLAVGLATTTAGAQSSFVTVNLASDLGNGVEVPLPLNQSIAVTGSVYRPAAATITQSATVVHVGDPDNQTLSIADSDPADGYSEGLRATVTGVTGNITASGNTGLIAAGASDASSVSVGYSTAAAGVYSGQVDLGLTSDGTGVDSLAPLSLGTDPVSFSVQVDNYATADLQETSGGGTLTGSAASGYTLDLGTIAQGSGPDTIDLEALNSAAGLADLLAGSFAITGDSAFTNSGFAGFSGLAAGQADNALSVALSTQADGTFSETITLNGTGSNASEYSAAVAPVTLTIEGQVSSETPVLAGGSLSGAITELPGTTGSPALDTAQGNIDFTDANLAASHTASVTSVSASGVTTGLPGNTTLLSLLSLGTLTEDTSSNLGSVAWDFAAPDDTFDYLAAGETLILTYAVQIAEEGGKSATQDVTVTVTGTNDLPQIAAGTTASATLTAVVAGAQTTADDTASGTIQFTDADLSDTHTASIASVVASGATTGLANNATLLGLLSTSALTEPSGATPGSVGWNFAAPDATFAYLTPGQTVTLTYAVDVSDNHGGTVAEPVTVTVTGAAGTVVQSATGGSFDGVNFASSSTDYTAAGKAYLVTYYDGSGNVVGTASYPANGGFAYTVGGVLKETKTDNPDRSYDVRYYSNATLNGTVYASFDYTYNAAGVVIAETFYDASGAAAASLGYPAGGGFSYTLGGVLNETKTDNADGGYDVRYYSSRSLNGTSYASFDYTYSAAGVLLAETFYDASGAAAARLGFPAGGGFSYTLGGVLQETKTDNADGGYDVRYYSSATLNGTAYASFQYAYTAAGVATGETFYDASGAVAATFDYGANGGYTYALGGLVQQVKTVNADGSFGFEMENVTGQTYTESFSATDQSGTLIAKSITLTNGSNSTVVHGTAETFTDVGGAASIANAADVLQLGPDTGGALNITGAANATLAFGTGDGAQVITGFATTGPGADALSFNSNVFADYAHLMNATVAQGNDLLITLDANDTLLLKNVSMSNFSSANVHFT